MEELQLEPATRYAGRYILPVGTTAAEALIIERQMQLLVLFERIEARQRRLIEVLGHEGVLPSDAMEYIIDGSVLEREMGL